MIDFNNQKGSNLGDPKFAQDAVNLRTLQRVAAMISGDSVSAVVSGITAGNNISITGTTSAITISLISSVTATSINAGTILSAGTDLYSIFITQNDGNDITRVQPGINTFTAGTGNLPTVNITGGSFSSFSTSGATTFFQASATTLSGGTIFSANTNLYSIFAVPSSIPYIQNGTNTYTAGTSTLPTVNISGGTFDNLTVTGNTILNGLTASTILTQNYIDFSGVTGVTAVSGRTYFDSNENALTYKPNTPLMDVSLNIGQETLIYVKNQSGSAILNGQACHISGSTGDKPTIQLAIATHIADESVVSGVATHDIANGAFGFITNFGIVRDIVITGGTIGDNIYLSDTIPGAFIYNSNQLSTNSRTSKIGRIITTGATGSILVELINEDTSETLTTREKNLLAIDSLSTGLYLFSGMTTASTTTFDIAPVSGWLVKNTGAYALTGDVINVLYTGGTNISTPYLTTSDASYVLITSANTVSILNTHPNAQVRRENIFLGTIVHSNRTYIDYIINTPDFDVSPISQLRDMMEPIGYINENVYPTANGANLSFNTSAGEIYGMGIGWINNNLKPNEVDITATTVTVFEYRTQTGGTFSGTTLIDPTTYDVAGVATTIPGGANVSTNQRIYLLPNNKFRVQYGQTTYTSLANAVAGLDSEIYTTFPNLSRNAILIGVISVRKGATDLSSSTDAKFTFASKFGEVIGGSGGVATTTLQQAYNNSTNPEIVTNSTLLALTIKNGDGPDDISNLLEGYTSGGTLTSFVRGDGFAKFSTLSANTEYIQGVGSTSATTAVTISNSASTHLMTIMDSGNVNIGNYSGSAAQRIFTVGQNGSFLSMGNYVTSASTSATTAALYLSQVTPSNTNYALFGTTAGQTVLNGSSINIRISDSNRAVIGSTGVSLQTGQGVAGTSLFSLLCSNNSNQTVGTNVPKMNYTIGTTQWLTGALPHADFFRLSQPGVAFVAASTATTVSTLGIDGAPTAGTNSNLFVSTALHIKQGIVSGPGTVATSFGAYINAQSGATLNYAIGASGDVVITGNTYVSNILTASTVGVGINPAFKLHVSQTSSASINETARFALAAGGTDAEPYITSQLYNVAAGTGTDLKFATSFSNPTANASLNAFTHATTTGYNIGGYYEALGGNINIGVVGKAITNKSNATNIGVVGIAKQTTGTPIRIGGYFALGGSDTPTFTSAALIADNGALSSSIFVAKDSGTTVFQINDGGTISNGSQTLGTENINFSGNTNLQTLTATTISANTITATGRVYNTISPLTIDSATTIDWSTNNIFDYTLTAATTFTFSNIVPGQTTVIAVRQPYTGTTGFNYSYSGSTVFWQGGTTPTITTTTGKTDIYTFISLSASSVYGSVLTNF